MHDTMRITRANLSGGTKVVPTSFSPPSYPGSMETGSCSPSPCESASSESHTVRPEKEKFTADETIFLKSYLPQYHAHCTSLLAKAEGPRMVKNTKGSKKEWIVKNVFNEFVKKFDANSPSGPNLGSLRVVRIFPNNDCYDFSTFSFHLRKYVVGTRTIRSRP